MARASHSQFNPEKHHRRSIRLKGYDYNLPGAYFVTMVTQQRECLFGEIVDAEMVLSDCGKIAEACWRAIPEHFPHVQLGAYVIMPNHVHGIIVIDNDASANVAPHADTVGNADRGAALLHPNDNPHRMNVKPGSLGAIVRSYKSAVSYRIPRERNAASIWQRNYYEHIIRNERELQRITDYINTNPLRWNDDNENPSQAKT